jgi:hypothetical protein
MPAINSTNAAHQGRYADQMLREQLDLRHYKVAARCKGCGARSYRRTLDGKCFECVCEKRKARKA